MTNDTDDITRTLRRALDGEPPSTLDPDAIVRRGRRRALLLRPATGVAAAVVAVAMGTVALAGASTGPGTVQEGDGGPDTVVTSPGAPVETSPGPETSPEAPIETSPEAPIETSPAAIETSPEAP